MSLYALKPERFLEQLYSGAVAQPSSELYCAGFELGHWRCSPLAFHLVEWLPDYALIEEELQINHANALVKLRQAAVRVYTALSIKNVVRLAKLPYTRSVGIFSIPSRSRQESSTSQLRMT
jgi:hypothetical protein